MVKEYDLLVVGTGNAGSLAAIKCKKEGWSVAIIDDRPFGGTCSQRGCDPKKVLVGAAELIDWNKRMHGKGIEEDSKINWSELMEFKRTFTQTIPEDTEEKYGKLGIDMYHGKAVFQSETELKVCSDVLKGKKILIATGAEPMKMDIEGEEYLTMSDEFMELDTLPKRIVFIGGGFISFEFAHVAARAGSEVHILHRSEKALKNFDQDLVKMLIKRSKEVGVHVHLNTPVNGIEKCGNAFVVKGEQEDREVEWKADLVVHGAGRVPALDMDLEKGNVKWDKQGVCVNEYMQSVSNPNVYAAGDVASSDAPPLTPVATIESHVVASNLLNGNNKTADYPVVPSVVFTVPKLASVGMSEQEAKESGLKVFVKSQDATEWFTYRRTNEGAAAFKVIIDQEKDVVLGAHLLSGEADELINHFALAIRFQIPVEELKKMPFAYPTVASDISYML
ncbi:NAD(P)/FAD-dependent oxidoreductase [Sporosarcina sp. P26b]|uniref:dihydrolipoyl dehydrogenase family protein n=1 Tax=Sporosarcina TaxID=1569 RepID=UPI000A17F3BA|nr:MULTISPECIES: NAD(P)/FAD-dependent oxidoreductase [Sporosarcina]ARK20667.1 pyridine nucleotide-disulfide oxidoreductase [Sporosarcina ureae]PIC74863.1 NAD(P)/FAD-dependent oxidoreductase [Sporosarcina sp. P17b]PIC97495.1 NAD(P)/FAD-dependent oxidoreductase [Sporosarcina sp. P26b]